MRQNWHDLEAVEGLRNLVKALLAERKLDEAVRCNEIVENSVHDFCLKPDAAPEINGIRNAIHHRLQDEYIRSHSDLAQLRSS